MAAAQVKTVRELKQLGPAPEGFTYAGSSLAYWCFDKESAWKVYDYCRWDSGSKKQQVVVELVPDVPSLHISQGAGASWKLSEHDCKKLKCEVCGVVFVRIPKK